MRTWIAAAFVMGALPSLAFSSLVWAEPAPPAADLLPAKTCETPADSTQQAADQRDIETVWSEAQQGGFPAIARRLDVLQRILAHAPACYPLIERRGSDIFIRDDAADASTTLMALMSATVQQQSVTVRRERNIYGAASLLMGAYANEMRRFDEAIRWLDIGLAVQPSNQDLVLEKATSLGQLRRYDEQVALLQAELDNPDAAYSLDRARFERNLGVALIDLNRLDDAEAALNESIRLQPDNPSARAELRYIVGLRAGAVATTQQMGPRAPDPEPKN